MREILLYGLSACVSLFILAYTVHIFVGGLVSEEQEYLIMGIVTFLGGAAIAWMAYDIIQSRRNR